MGPEQDSWKSRSSPRGSSLQQPEAFRDDGECGWDAFKKFAAGELSLDTEEEEEQARDRWREIGEEEKKMGSWEDYDRYVFRARALLLLLELRGLKVTDFEQKCSEFRKGLLPELRELINNMDDKPKKLGVLIAAARRKARARLDRLKLEMLPVTADYRRLFSPTTKAKVPVLQLRDKTSKSQGKWGSQTGKPKGKGSWSKDTSWQQRGPHGGCGGKKGEGKTGWSKTAGKFASGTGKLGSAGNGKPAMKGAGKKGDCKIVTGANCGRCWGEHAGKCPNQVNPRASELVYAMPRFSPTQELPRGAVRGVVVFAD